MASDISDISEAENETRDTIACWQELQSHAGENSGVPQGQLRYFYEEAVMVVDGKLFAGQKFGLKSDIKCILRRRWSPWSKSFVGFMLQFALGDENADAGLGIRLYNTARLSHDPSPRHCITVHFPTDAEFKVSKLDKTGHLAQQLPNDNTSYVPFCVLEVKFQGHIEVDGFGMPFANAEDPAGAYLNRNEPMFGQRSLLDIIEAKELQFLVPGRKDMLKNAFNMSDVPPPFSYPYGTIHQWDMARYNGSALAHRGPEFCLSKRYYSDENHVASLTQFVVQEFWWFHVAAERIKKIRLPATFALTDPSNSSICMVVPQYHEIAHKFATQWRKLTWRGICKIRVHIFGDPVREYLELQAKIDHDFGEARGMVLTVRIPGNMGTAARRADMDRLILLANTPTAACNLPQGGSWIWVSVVLDARRDEAARKVDAVCAFLPDAHPTSVTGESHDQLNFRMSLHRDLMNGRGFYGSLRHRGLMSLPTVNCLPTNDNLLSAWLMDITEPNRLRLCNYLRNRPLGFGIITAGLNVSYEWKGRKRTTLVALCVGALAMTDSVGPVYATAPTCTDVDFLAQRLDRMSRMAVLIANEPGRSPGQVWCRRKLIIRGYAFKDEYKAFMILLKNPWAGDTARPYRAFSVQSDWKFHRSLSYWLLLALGSPAPRRELKEDDAPYLSALRSEFDRLTSVNELHPHYPLRRLVEVARGKISWAAYARGFVIKQRHIEPLFNQMMEFAQVVCTTPTLSCQGSFAKWNSATAKAIVVHDAGHMSRPDLYSV